MSHFNIKVIQNIAFFLSDDADLCRMVHTCYYFAATITPPCSGVWRERFLDLYDHPSPGKTSEEIKIEYKIRSIMLSRSVSFEEGEGNKEKLWLVVLATLLAGTLIDKPI